MRQHLAHVRHGEDFHGLGVEAFNDLGRCARRREQREPLIEHVTRHTRFLHRRNVRHERGTLRTRHRECAQAAGLQVRQGGRQPGEKGLHVAGEDINERSRRGLVRYVHHLDAREVGEKRHGEVLRAADAPEEYRICRGRAFASAINSFTDFTGMLGCTTRTVGNVASMVIGVKLLNGS